jgi:hypothetical protein
LMSSPCSQASISRLSHSENQNKLSRKQPSCTNSRIVTISYNIIEDCLALSTNNKSFYIYAYEDEKYKLIYDVEPMQI